METMLGYRSQMAIIPQEEQLRRFAFELPGVSQSKVYRNLLNWSFSIWILEEARVPIEIVSL